MRNNRLLALLSSCTKRLALCIGCLACSLALYAGEVILVGDVLNETTGEPIPNVHLYLQGTQQGTVTNDEGSFCLKADIDRKRRLIISAVGYHTQRYDIEPNTMAGMQVLLREKTNLLAEVVALPGENPAIPLIAQVRAHRAFNDRTLQSQDACPGTQASPPAEDTAAKSPGTSRPVGADFRLHLSGSEQTWVASTELYISHIGKRQLQRHLWKSLRAGLLTTDDSTFLLPLYRSTQPVQLIGKGMRPAGEKQEQALILSASDYSVLLTPPQNLNFYLNTLDILGESFLSPLASSGNTYYHYYLADSVAGAYLVHFRTKNPFYATFNGEMWIDSTTYAVRSVYAEVPAQSRVNYLSQLQIRQQFAPDHSLSREQISVLLDFAVKTDTTHLFPTVLLRTEVRDERLRTQDERLNSNDSENSETNVTSPSSFILHPSSPLDSLPIIRVAKFAATVLTTGYIPTGTCIDIGNIREILDFGESEYVHLGLPLRTNERLWKNVSLEAAAGYGFHDQRWKGLGRVSINLPTQRRNILRLEYQDHYIATEVDGMYPYYHENFFGKRQFDITSFLFRNLYTNAQAVNTYSRQREFRIETENDWSDLLETRLYAHVGRWDPWYTAQAANNLAPGILATAPYRYRSIGAVFRLSWGERKVDGYFLRRYVHSQYPTLFLSAEAGSVQEQGTRNQEQGLIRFDSERGAGGYSMYAKLQVLVKQRARLGMGGTLDWAFSAGYIFGDVPYPMRHHFEGNQSYAFDPYRFTLMNNLQYSARGWLSLHALWDGQGVLFNLIPGIRYCRLHELLDFKLAWGDGDLLRSPYTEVGVGIGNIFRVGEVFAVWRLTNRQDLTTPTWGIRFRFKLGL
ncbi:MAG: DUF5686 family protein [Paludibacteraceae bacterium]|nr:DUF5686 family protein [Paludibacteraceae bacterium]